MMKNVLRHSFIFGVALSLWAPTSAKALDAATLQQYVGQEARVPVIKPSWGNFIIHADRLKSLYSLRSYQPIWVDAQGNPNSMARALKDNLTQQAETHGLNSNDYWDADVETLFQATLKNPKNAITFEMAASEALIRYASHLSGGRLDPSSIDDDIKFKKKIFGEYSQLNAAVSYGVDTFWKDIERFVPQHPIYPQLRSALLGMRRLKNNFTEIKSPGFELKIGVNDPVITALRQRFSDLGYRVDLSGGNLFDGAFQDVVVRYQRNNNLVADGKISVKSALLNSLNTPPSQRISQIQASMEKLRWMPKNLGPRHIFVNLAATNFKLYDGGIKVFDFKTVNGQPFRRTPMMEDAITFVNLNPYWTVPRSIAIKDKLAQLKANPNYLDQNDMLLIDERTDKVVNPKTINWSAMTAANFTYYIRQLPGRHNALGVVKFPLQNPWAIYLHDTNEKGLFKERERHLSSGCVRLEEPIKLAAYLIGDQGWSIDKINAYVPQDYSNYIPGELDKRVTLKQRMPVYLMYLTVDVTDEGEIRFLADPYGQDSRIALAIKNQKAAGEVF